MLGTGGGAPPGESCLDGKPGRPLGRSGALLRPPAGVPGSLGGPPLGLPPPPKGLGPPDRPPGGRMGPRLGPESDREQNGKINYEIAQNFLCCLSLFCIFFFFFFYHWSLCSLQISVLASHPQTGLLSQQEPHHHILLLLPRLLLPHHLLLLWVLIEKNKQILS